MSKNTGTSELINYFDLWRIICKIAFQRVN